MHCALGIGRDPGFGTNSGRVGSGRDFWSRPEIRVGIKNPEENPPDEKRNPEKNPARPQKYQVFRDFFRDFFLSRSWQEMIFCQDNKYYLCIFYFVTGFSTKKK